MSNQEAARTSEGKVDQQQTKASKSVQEQATDRDSSKNNEEKEGEERAKKLQKR